MSTKNDIISSKVYLGHPKNQSNPKTRDSWIGEFNGIVVFDPAKIQQQLDQAKKIFADAKKQNKEVLIICEKELYREEIEQLAVKSGVHYLNYKVPAGVLTNFDTLLSRTRSLNELRLYVDSESFRTLTKKEQQMKLRSLKKIELVYKGVVNLRKKPDLVIIVDGELMDKFVAETEKLDVDAIILASSNFSRWSEEQVVMCNVNSKQSIDYVLQYIIG